MSMSRDYNPSDALSIFKYSGKLLHHTLSDVIPAIDSTISAEIMEQDGKGGLGVLVEKYFFGYEPNSSPEADFREAGVELKVSPLKKIKGDKLTIKERLVCDMIDYMNIVNEDFEDSRFFKKSILMLIIFYLHLSGYKHRDLEFIYSVLWQIKDKDLLIIKNDFLTIREKVRQGKAHEISEGDTLYLGACRKGNKKSAPRTQPYSDILALPRAFSLKTAYMRTILDFVQSRGTDMATNLTNDDIPGIELVTTSELKENSFEDILKERFTPYIDMDYRQIADSIGITFNPGEKSKNATAVKNILSKGLKSADDAEELRKAGIKIKTIRLEKNGTIKEHLSFENINYKEVLETDDWVDSKWYDIITTRYMFVIFRQVDGNDSSWANEKRYVLDKMFFWTMPSGDFPQAERFWLNIKENVINDTLQNDNNTFWRIKDKNFFHVRPKAQNVRDITFSPISGDEVPKKAYWFDKRYIMQEVKNAYGPAWDKLFTPNRNS